MDSLLVTCQTSFADLDAAFRNVGDGANIRAFGINWYLSLNDCECLVQYIRAARNGEEPPMISSPFRVEYDDDADAVLISRKNDTLILEGSIAEDVCKWFEEGFA